MEFTFAAYRRALQTARARFDRITSAADFLDEPAAQRAAGSVLILRHDCERDLTKALEIARIERDLGLRGSYYIRVHSEYYNLMLPAERAILRQIAGMGHEIGLHYEPRFYDQDGMTLLDGIRADTAVLRAILGADHALRSLTPHQPTLSPPDFAALAHEGLVDLYTHPDFRPLDYYSDSGMRWREKTLQQAAETGTRVQFLTHPDFWNDTDIGWVDNLTRRVQACHRALDAVATHETEVLHAYLANRKAHDARFRAALEPKE